MRPFSTGRLVLRGLRHYRTSGVFAAFGIAVATACVTGSLLIGVSMEGSLRDRALARLGAISDAYESPIFHDQRLAGAAETLACRVTPAICLKGVVERSATGVSVSSVRIDAVDPGFWSFFPGEERVALQGRGAAISCSLARDLGLPGVPGPVDPPEGVIVTVERETGARAGSLFAHQRADKTQRKVRVEIAQVLADAAGGGFALHGGSDLQPRNLFLSREWFSRAIAQPDRFNTLLMQRPSDAPALDTAELLRKLNAAAEPEDVGLRLVVQGKEGFVSLESPEVVLPNALLDAIDRVAARQGWDARHISIYLANRIAVLEEAGPESAYALVAAVQPPSGLPFKKGGGAEPGADGIWLTDWLAQDLEADVGSRLSIAFPIPSADGVPRTETRTLTVRGMVDLNGPGVGPGFTPSVEGITEAKTMDAWSLPFPVDRSKIKPRDESYWETYHATPKAFIALELARQLWTIGSPGDSISGVTSVRLARPEGQSEADFVEEIKTALCGRLSLSDTGASLRPVRDEALAGARGNADFSQLFLGLSFFIILAALGLSASLMRLQAQRRSGEAGLLLASGFSVPRLMRMMLLEGTGWAVLGGLLGTAGGVGYAIFLVHALNSFWHGAVAGTPLRLHLDLGAVAAGGLFGVLAGAGAAWWGARSLILKPVVDLLGGWRASAVRVATGSGRSLYAGAGLLAAVALLIVLAAVFSWMDSTAAFFGAGGALLIAALLLVGGLFGSAWRRRLRPLSMAGLALRSASLFRGRSVLLIGLLSSASFVLVAVASQRRDPRRLDVSQRDSGAGGFALRVDTALELRYDLGTPEGRRRIGFQEDEEALFKDTEVVSLLASPGDEISCLNLSRPAQPRLLGVGAAMVARGGFRVVGAGEAGWHALERTGTGAVPVFGDAASVQWTLHAGVGQEYSFPYGSGACQVRFEGVLPASIFAGELLMGERSFRKLYPQVDWPTCFLVAVPMGRETEVAAVLRRRLAAYGGEVRSTREILAAFLSVQNTYLSVFLALGGLGLLLSTVGLLAILLRNVHERRSELALLQVTGFSSRRLMGLVNLEYSGLLLAGLGVGTCSALVAVVPSMRAADAEINYLALTGILAGILVFGMAICSVTSWLVSRQEALDALRRE